MDVTINNSFAKTVFLLSSVAMTSLLTACSGGGGTTPPTSPPPPVNAIPTVYAGTDQTVFETKNVVLNGAISDADSTPTFEWVQTSGTTVNLEDDDTLSPSFATPTITTDDILIFELRANDGVNTVVTDTVQINVTNVDEITLAVLPKAGVFPLLLAMAEDDLLPISILPIEDGTQAQALFDSGQADGLFVETFTGAKLRSVIPDLTLVFPFTWRGYFQVADASVSSFADLQGKTVSIPGPAATTTAGSTDIIFRAAAKRQSVDPDVDMTVTYQSNLADALIQLQTNVAQSLSTSSPFTTQIVNDSIINGSSLDNLIDFQAIFNGPNAVPNFPSVPVGQMPLSGLHMRAAALDTSGKRNAVELILNRYADAANRINTNPDSYSDSIETEYNAVFGGVNTPAFTADSLVSSVLNGNLVYRTDITTNVVQADLSTWINELIGTTPDANYFNSDFGPFQSGAGGVLPAEVVDVMALSLADERLAWSTYDAVLQRFGTDTRPFVNIKKAEQSHIDSVLGLYNTYDEPVPDDETTVDPIVQTATLAELCQVGVDAEIANIKLYDDTVLPAVQNYADIKAVMTRLRDASENSHLPAFKRCAG